jgi:hypothetical protein
VAKAVDQQSKPVQGQSIPESSFSFLLRDSWLMQETLSSG